MDWPQYLMGFALHASLKSKDSTKVGAVLVGQNNEVLLTGFNGPPIGVQDLPERREKRPEKYLWVSHAEANLIAFAARQGIRTEGCTVYVTHCPCSGCAKALIQAGIKKVVIGNGLTAMPADEFLAAQTMLFEAGVELVRG